MTPDSRLCFVEIEASHRPETLAEVVLNGLSAFPKRLPCRYFYDSAGSHLFERICRLPEYYLTRIEQSVLERYAEQIIASAGDRLAIVEFGSGSSCKTRLLLTAALNRQRELHYTSIDISREFLRISSLDLLADYDRLLVTAIAGEYNDAIDALPDEDLPRLLLFLGSNIGNFTHDEAVDFLARIRRKMRAPDRILVGIDLRKDPMIVEAAYNDSQGVTAQFNKNLLRRINSELGGRFDPNAFEHHAPFKRDESRIEMHLRSRYRQTVPIRALEREFVFEPGETIHTENSHKYSMAAFDAIVCQAGLAIDRPWFDPKEWFAVLLLKPEGV